MQSRLQSTLKRINTYITSLAHIKLLSDEDQRDLTKCMLELQLSCSQFQVKRALRDINDNTTAYIYAHSNQHSEVSALLSKQGSTIDVAIVVKGYIDGGNFSAAEKLVQQGHIKIADLHQAYLRFAKPSQSEYLDQIATFHHLIAACRSTPNDEASLRALREHVITCIEIDITAPKKLNHRFFELCRIYNNTASKQNSSLFSRSTLQMDITKIDAASAHYLEGKLSAESMREMIQLTTTQQNVVSL